MVRAIFSAVTHNLSRLAKLWADDDEAAIASTKSYWDGDVALTLGNLVRETETRASGRVQLISLADFREGIGALWEQYHGRILLIAESTIARMIGKGNTFIAQEDDTWLLLFPSVNESEAVKRAEAIATKIGEKLVGASFTPQELPLPEAAKLDLGDALNADGHLNLEAIRRAVSKARTSLLKPAPLPPRPKPPASTTNRAARSVASELQILYRPAWSIDTESIDSIFFRAFTATGSDVFDDPASAPNDATALDLADAALRAFIGMCNMGVRAKFGLPIPFGTLEGPQHATLQQLVGAIRQEDRLMKLRVEITHVPETARPEEFVAVRELLRGYVREVAFMTNLFNPNESILGLDHIALGADVTDAGAFTEDELREALLLFRQRAGKRATYVLGLRSRAQLGYALHAGIGEVGGQAVAADLKQPFNRVEVIRRQAL